MYGMKYLEKKKIKLVQRKKPEEQHVVQKTNKLMSDMFFYRPDGKKGSQVCQLARGEKQEDGRCHMNTFPCIFQMLLGGRGWTGIEC